MKPMWHTGYIPERMENEKERKKEKCVLKWSEILLETAVGVFINLA